jgi:hypothetical protein
MSKCNRQPPLKPQTAQSDTPKAIASNPEQVKRSPLHPAHHKNKRDINMLTLPRHATITAEQLTKAPAGESVRLSLTHWTGEIETAKEAVIFNEVQATLFSNGSVSWFNPIAKDFEWFRNPIEAQTEITLILLGLKKVIRQLSYKSYRAEMICSVLSQQPERVQDYFRSEDCYLVDVLEYIHSFCFYPINGEPTWFSHASYEEARAQFVLAVDYDIDYDIEPSTIF